MENETMRRRLLHWLGWKLVGLTSWLDHNIQLPFSAWNLALHSWMEHNHLCCSRHGYHADPKYVDPKEITQP